VKVRKASPDDAAAMADVLNAVIAIGGTTAHEVPKSAAEVRDDYVDGVDVLSSVVAEDAGRIVGWQSVGFWLGEEHIGTFVAPGLQAKGVGVGLFAMTRSLLAEREVRQVFATIRADNVAGLAYYTRLGFREIGNDPDFALRDGRRVGRVHRRLDL
jgi:L-amino acid N-acyltransferase YncA